MEEAQEGRRRNAWQEFAEMAEEFGEGFLRGAADIEGVFRGKRREAAEQDGGRSRGNVCREEGFGGAEAAVLPTGVFERRSAIDALNVAYEQPGLVHQAGGDAVGRSLFDTQQSADIGTAHTPLLRGQLQHAKAGGIGLEFRQRQAPVTQMRVPLHRGESRFAPAKELAIGYVAALHGSNLPVPGAKLLRGIEPVLRRREFLDGESRHRPFEERDDAGGADGVAHRLRGGDCRKIH